MAITIGGFRIGGRKAAKPVSARLEEVKEMELITLARARIALIDNLVQQQPQVAALALFPRLAKMYAVASPAAAAPGPSDRLNELLMKRLESDLSADPLDKILKLRQSAAAVRELEDELAPEPVQPAPALEGAAGIFQALLDSAFGAQLGAGLVGLMSQGQAATTGGAISPEMMRGAGVVSVSSPLSGPVVPLPPAAQPLPQLGPGTQEPPPGPVPAADVAEPSPFMVTALLAMLRVRPPEEMAGRLLEEAGRRPEVAEMLSVVLDASEEDLPEILKEWESLPGWGRLATWLLAHMDYTVDLLSHIRETAADPSQAS